MSGSLAWLLIMFLRNLLSVIGGQTPPQGFRYASYEVTIPRKLIFKYGQQETQDVSYLLQIEGKGQVVRLRRKRGTIPRDFPIFTYNKEGDLLSDYHYYIRDDCFYSGFIQDKPLSSVTLSTCSGGLRGLLQLNNETYQIEPVQPSATFQHVVYRLEIEEGAMHMRCGLTEEEQRRQEAMIQDAEHVAVKSAPAGLWWPHKRHAEVAFVVEHERYVKFNKNETDIAMKLLEAIHVINSFFEPLFLDVSVAGLEIWTEKNLIDVDKSMGATLKAFSIWRRNTLLNHLKNDAAHLIVYRSYRGIIGIAYVGQICSEHFATGVVASKNFNLFDFSVLFAHEFGHNLGMSHDESDCTPCGTGMMCISRECKNVSLLQYDCNATKCHNRGICNNHKHCHCSYGWAPPDCLKEGYGGSIDSGPISKNWNGVSVGSIVGSVLVLSTVTAAVGMGVYYRFVLSNKIRRKSSRISPS
ncbi:and metalloproteinase domain-containing 20-like [Podarcis lilfordi]|uniref:And metalloproteinase domain-containing 20-like n=1 Tax=Podarcis lilfordi TaxID=74358 RepID=A0AA35K7Q6_9SAUR|nr:and metalloproteinase domain-containing 20-like [Podarcis lilfordi]